MVPPPQHAVVKTAMCAVRDGRGEQAVEMLEQASLCIDFAEEYARAAEAWALSASSWEVAKSRWLRCSKVAKQDPGYVYLSMGHGALKWGREFEAREAFREARDALGDDETSAADWVRRLDGQLIESWHWRMICDVERNLAFSDALKECCRGKTVLDVGTGTGILSVLAARSGSTRIVACERSDAMAEVARRTFEKHDVVVEMRVGDSSEVITDEDAFDVAVAEVFDAALFGEGALETLRQAHRVAQVLVPARATLCCAVVHSPVLRRRCVFDGRITVEPYDVVSLDAIPHNFLSNVARFEDILLLRDDADDHRHLGTRRLTRIAEGVADAIVAWFELDMLGDKRFVLSTAPRNCRGPNVSYLATSWQQAVFGIAKNENFESVTASLVRGDSTSEFLKLALDGEDERIVFMTPTQVERANDSTWREAYATEEEEASRVLEIGFGSSIASPLTKTVARCSTSLDDLNRMNLSTFDFDKVIHSLVDPSGQLRTGALEDIDRCVAQYTATKPLRFAPAAATAFGVLVDAPDLAATQYARETGIQSFDASALDEFASPHARDIELYSLHDGNPIVNILAKPVRLLVLEDFENMPPAGARESHARTEWSFRRAPAGPLQARAALPVSHQVVAEKAGIAHALLIWWRLHFRHPREKTISTSPLLDALLENKNVETAVVVDSSSTHWRVAAFILNGGTGVPLNVDDQVKFTTALRHSQIHVDGLSIS